MTNFDAIQKNIATYLGQQDKQVKKQDAAGKKLIVDALSVSNAKAHASAAFMDGKTVSLPLPDILLRDLGKSKGGLAPGELGQAVAQALRQQLAIAFSFDMRRPITQGAPMRDLAPSVPPAGVALSLLLLAAKVLPQRAASIFVRVNMLVKRLMADWQLASNLLRTPLQAQQIGGLLAQPGGHSSSVSALLRSLDRQLTGLLGSTAFKPAVARKLPADGRFVSIQQIGNLSLIVSGFHKGVDLISFHLAEMFVVHGQL